MRVLLIDVDSLRPDHLGCYGYERDTSPHIDRLAAQSVVFTNCFASDTPCLPSRTALATGRFGVKNGVNTHNGPGQQLRRIADGHRYFPDRIPTFALLGETMRTASISSFAHRHKAPWFSAAFRETYNPPHFRNGLETADDVTPLALEWLDRHGKEEHWLLHVNYWDVHHPYPVTREYVANVSKTWPKPKWPSAETIAKHREMIGIRTAGQWNAVEDEETMAYRQKTEPRIGNYPMPFSYGADEYEFVINGYDAAIRLVDSHVRKLAERLEAIGVYEETAIIITADHGDAFGEHGIYAEHAFAHPANQNVPLIVKWPGGKPGVCDALVYQFDVMAALAEACGKSVPSGWDAVSLLPALTGRPFPGRPYLVCTQGTFTFSRAVVTKEWLYIRTIHPGTYDFEPEMLHRRTADPHCERNLMRDIEHRGAADALKAHLTDWWYETAGTAGVADPLFESLAVGPYVYGAIQPYVDRLKERGEDAKLERLRARLAPLGIRI